MDQKRTHFELGDKLKCIFKNVLPGNTVGPDLKLGLEYPCKNIFVDSQGYQHLDVGITTEFEMIRSYATKEVLPGGTAWVHPNRFVLIN